jgi:hypothetical protein
MIDLKNTCVLVRTKEENEMLLKEAKKQGFRFRWAKDPYCKSLQGQHFPDILKFCGNKDMFYRAYISSNYTFYEASELLNTKEMTAREFAERIADISNCNGDCSECVLYFTNTKCNRSLCNVCNWKDDIDELLEIAKAGKATVLTPKEKAIEDIEKIYRESRPRSIK